MFSKNIYIIHIIYVYKSFPTALYEKGLRKNIKKKKKRRDGEIGKHKLNKIGALNMK